MGNHSLDWAARGPVNALNPIVLESVERLEQKFVLKDLIVAELLRGIT